MKYLRVCKNSPQMLWLNFVHPSPKDERLCKSLWVAGSCHQWITNFAAPAKPLYAFLPDTPQNPLLKHWNSHCPSPSPQITQFWQTSPPILPWEEWDRCRYSRTTFSLSHTPHRIFLMSVGPYGIRHTPVPKFINLAATLIHKPVALHKFPLFTFLFPCCISPSKSVKHNTSLLNDRPPMNKPVNYPSIILDL